MTLVNRDMTVQHQLRHVVTKLRPEYQMAFATQDTWSMEKLKDVCLEVEIGISAQRDYSQINDKYQNQNNNNTNINKVNYNRQNITSQIGNNLYPKYVNIS